MPPADGWTGALAEVQRDALATGFAALTRDGDAEAALAVADRLLAQTPDFPPALVLAGQAELSKGVPADARALLESSIDLYPGYRAAHLLWARLLELGGDTAGAHAEYRGLADQLPVAAQRAAATRESAIAAAQAALAKALAGMRIDQARAWAERIAEWESPDSPAALEARAAVERAAGDEVAELSALRALYRRGRSEPDLRERLAALEIEHGDADEGLRLLEGLLADAPEDTSLRNRFAAAQLRFRLRLLPETVRGLASRRELERADFAALLYWLVPGVRQTQGGSARIASDVLDHPWQREIVRVVNRGLMKTNPALHRFEPGRPLSRLEALESAIEVAAARDGGECVQGATAHPEPSRDYLCGVAVRCRLIDEIAECLPQAPVSGGEALEILGRALSLQKVE